MDEIGVGRGVADRLKEQNFDCEGFNASKRPDHDDEFVTFQNQRAASYARLRDMLVQGRVGLPPDPLLREELLTRRAHLNSSGRLQIWSKDDWRKVIKRSPDRLDAVVMAVAGSGAIVFTTNPMVGAF